jgi:ribonucleotide reductase beta subunit family protein with ferritin-like domain
MGTQSRTDRADFQATADPALNEAADRTADIKLLAYGELYDLWERQQWQTQELDFTRDREDWHERISPEERFQRMYGLSSFFIGEQKVAEELGPIMRARRPRSRKSSSARRSPTRPATSASSSASTARSGCWSQTSSARC